MANAPSSSPLTDTPVQPQTRPAPGDQAPDGTQGTGPAPCPRCGGSGRIEGQAVCPACQGQGTVVTGIGGG